MTGRPPPRSALLGLLIPALLSGCRTAPSPPEPMRVVVPGTPAEAAKTAFEKSPRDWLPDLSEGLVGRVGPFLWGRAADLGGEVRFCDGNGAPTTNGNHLWLYQFKRLQRRTPDITQLHERNNLQNMDRRIGYDVQFSRILINHPLEYVFKLVFGYKQAEPVWLHGDNTDLVHLAGAARVCVFLPVRTAGARGHPHGGADIPDQRKYWISAKYQMDSACVIEFGPTEHISHKWFDPKNLDPHILFDLAPHLKGKNRIYPGITKPIFRFAIDGRGGWRLFVEPDGRDGLKGGTSDGGWDMEFSHKSAGAKPYTVNVTSGNSTWSMSTFSPGGRPEESSELVIRLAPFDRETGKPVPWADRSHRVRTFYLEDLDRVLAGASPFSIRQPGMKPKGR